MDSAKKILNIVFKCMSKLSDKDIENLISGEYKLICVPVNKKQIQKNIKIDIDKDIKEVCNFISDSKSKEEVIKILVDSKFTKDKLIQVGKFFEISTPKSYTKGKIIDKIVDMTIGARIDQESINNVSIN